MAERPPIQEMPSPQPAAQGQPPDERPPRPLPGQTPTQPYGARLGRSPVQPPGQGSPAQVLSGQGSTARILSGPGSPGQILSGQNPAGQVLPGQDAQGQDPDLPSVQIPGQGQVQQSLTGGVQDRPAGASDTAPPRWPNQWLSAGNARIQALDKVNAQATILTMKVGQPATFGSLTIMVKACLIRPPDQPADAAAYLDVTDSHPESPGFNGWMLVNEPSVSMMQNPIYDLRVAGCG